MIIYSMRLNNFMGFHGEHFRKLVDKDVIGIIGEYKDNSLRSNQSGKCFKKNTPVMMYDGTIKKVQDVTDGDKVMGPDSKPRIVHGTTSGREAMYRVCSTDEEIDFTCNESHILSVKASRKINILGSNYEKDQVISISVHEYLKLQAWKKKMLNVYRCGEVHFSNTKKLPLPPYLLGVWLGDGNSHSPRFTLGDIEILEYLKDKSKELKTNFIPKEFNGKTQKYWEVSLTGKATGHRCARSSTSVVSRELKNLNVLDNKHIPNKYLQSSVQDRLELLAGIVDTDGHLANGQYYEVTTKYKQLNKDITYLCRSLGLDVTTKEKIGTICGVDKGLYYRISIKGDVCKIPCKVKRKSTTHSVKRKDVLRKSFTVEAVGLGTYFGFGVDRDSLFLLGDFTVVHNSTVLEAVFYCFFGQSRAKKDVELIHYGEEVMWVEIVVIDDNKKKYTIKRGRDIKNNGILEVDFQDKKVEGQDAINKLLGFDKKEFELTTYFKQSDITQFMELGSSEQKNHIIKWFNIEHWAKLEKSVKDDLSDLNKELNVSKIKLQQLKESFENDIDLDVEKTSIQSMMSQLKEKITSREKKLKALDTQETMTVNDFDKIEYELQTAKEEKAELEGRAGRVEGLQDNLKNLKDLIGVMKEEIDITGDLMSIQEATEKKSEAQQELKLVHAKLEAHEGNKGVCPLIHEPCDRIKLGKEQLAQLHKKRTRLPEIMNNMDDVIKKHKHIKFTEERIKNTQEKVSEANEKIHKLTNGLESKITAVTELITKLRNSIKAYNPNLAEEKSELRNKLKMNKAKLEEHQKDLGRIEEKEASKKRNKEQVKILSKEIKELSMKVDDLNYLAMMFGKNGIPSQEIENGFQQVEDDANTILNSMNTGMEIIFKPTRELDAKEPSCLVCGHIYEKGFRGSDCPQCQEPRRNKQKDEMNFQVTTSDNAYGFHMDSGGGKSLLATAIRMALTQLKRRMGKCNLNVIFLDEPDANLDNFNADAFTKMVTNILTKELGIAQVFWVSHNKDIQGSIPHILKVVKHEGKASTKWC